MSSPVSADRDKSLLFVGWLAFLGLVGLALGGATFSMQWGFFGYAGAGFLGLASVGGLGGMLVGGGSWTSTCPGCGAPMNSSDYAGQRNELKVLRCAQCATYVHGKTELDLVPTGCVHAVPVFEAALPEAFSWPSGCPTCGGAVTRRVRVEGRSAVGSAAMVAAPVGVQRVLVIEAPACDVHEDGVAAARGDGRGDRLLFRSFDYWRRFVEANPA